MLLTLPQMNELQNLTTLVKGPTGPRRAQSLTLARQQAAAQLAAAVAVPGLVLRDADVVLKPARTIPGCGGDPGGRPGW